MFKKLYATTPAMEIIVNDLQSDLNLDPLPIRAIVESVLALENVRVDEVAIHFVDEERIIALHDEFFSDPTPTDCISFPMDTEDEGDNYRVLGDVFVCPKTALGYCRSHGGSPLQEVALYVVHGLLHLLGYDDLEEQEEKLMRQAEARHMAHLHPLLP